MEPAAHIQKALEELHQFLSDRLPPLMVADSIALLSKNPPELAASSIQSWAVAQNERERSTPLSDYLYHALVKIHLMRAYKLIPSEELLPFLDQLIQIVLEFCPTEDREMLKVNLDAIEHAPGAVPSSLEVIFRPKTTGTSLASAHLESARSIRRFGHVKRRLERELAASRTSADPRASERREKLVADGLAEAGRAASESIDLDRFLVHLRHLGIDADTDHVFRALGRQVPGWSFPSRPDLQIPESSSLQAMRRLIAKAPNPEEAAVRFHQLVKATVERFNEGSLGQASSMIDLAGRIMAAKEVEDRAAEIVRSQGDESLDEAKLRAYAETPQQRPLLRKLLNFFVALTPQGLLQSLRREPKRERRRVLLLFLEAHGESSRVAALEYLRTPLGPHVTDEEVYFRRNLIYLLRRIPASSVEPVEEIVDIILSHASLNLPPLLVREALAYLPQLKHDKVERALTQLLQQIESMLLNPKEGSHEAQELLPLLGRVATALCRLGTPGAQKTVIHHALKKKPGLGDTMARMAELSKQDLSADPETLDMLLDALESNLPLAVLGVVFPQRDRSAKQIAEAISGTPVPAVRRALEKLAQRHPNREAGRAAAKALSGLLQTATTQPTSETSTPSLMGDLDLFGLPGLVQKLADSAVTGTLTLKIQGGEIFSVMTLEKGRLRSCRTGALSSDAAFYQLLERPQPGTFQFTRTLEDGCGSETDSKEIASLLLEGIRRHDELQRAAVIVPDGIRLKAKAAAPSPAPGEEDGLLIQDLWSLLQKGATPLECDAALTVDSFRIGRLLAHWVETGAIEGCEAGSESESL